MATLRSAPSTDPSRPAPPARDTGPQAPDPVRDRPPEWWLRAAAVHGDHAAFAALYRTYRGYVLGYLVRRCRGDRHLAEDLTQETFTRAFTKLAGYQDTGRPFGAWLVTIAANLLIDHWRSGWRRYQVPWHDFTGSGAGAGSGTGSGAGEGGPVATGAGSSRWFRCATPAACRWTRPRTRSGWTGAR